LLGVRGKIIVADGSADPPGEKKRPLKKKKGPEGGLRDGLTRRAKTLGVL